MPPLPPDFCLDPPGSTRQQSFFVLAHVDAQRVKTRGPNPNPTAQAQSKRCLPLFTKTQKIIKMHPSGLPNPIIFCTFFEPFPWKCLKDSGPRPKVPKRPQHAIPRSPKWRPGMPNWSPKVPKSTKKTQKCTPGCKNVGKSATMKPQVTYHAKKAPRGHPKWH